MDIILQEFISEVNLKFAFLEEYGYKKIEDNIENEDYYPDSEVVVKYIGDTVGIEVYWYFAGANIGVVFFELQKGEIPVKKIFFGESEDASRAINLYTLAKYLDKWDNKLFLLKDVDNVAISEIKKREKVIKENMSGIIEGLSTAVIKLAANIISGDTSIFNDVMHYQSELIKKQFS
ncbi:MAG TPA: hypothetical protein PLC07_01605 [Bacillota bacterium]|nr:hypothetical protein [Bacillota bacterium]HPT87612.1 hypothetical protein [Bacillota bacterium]